MGTKNANLAAVMASDDEGNVPSVSIFAGRINAEKAKSNSAWIEVGRILVEAQNLFSPTSQEMKELLAETDITEATKTKLVKIAQSKRLARHQHLFETVSSWTSLYSVTTMSETEFQTLISRLEDGEPCTVALVDRIRGNPRAPKDGREPILTISVPRELAGGGGFSEEMYASFLDQIQEVLAKFPALEWSEGANTFRRSELRFQKLIIEERAKALKKLIRRAVAGFKKSSREWKQYNNKKLRKDLQLRRPEIAALEEDEFIRAAFEDPARFLPDIGSSFDEAAILAEAETAAHKKLGVKLNA